MFRLATSRIQKLTRAWNGIRFQIGIGFQGFSGVQKGRGKVGDKQTCGGDWLIRITGVIKEKIKGFKWKKGKRDMGNADAGPRDQIIVKIIFRESLTCQHRRTPLPARSWTSRWPGSGLWWCWMDWWTSGFWSCSWPGWECPAWARSGWSCPPHCPWLPPTRSSPPRRRAGKVQSRWPNHEPEKKTENIYGIFFALMKILWAVFKLNTSNDDILFSSRFNW